MSRVVSIAVDAAIALALLTLAAGMLCVVGCGDARPQRPGGDSPPGVVATLGQLGVALTWAGGIGAAVGVAGAIIALAYPPLAWLGILCRVAAPACAGILGVGASVQFLASHPWTMGLAIAGSLGAVVWYHWADVRRFLAHREAVKL